MNDEQQPRLGHEFDGQRQHRPGRERKCDRREHDAPLVARHRIERRRHLDGRHNGAQGGRCGHRGGSPARQLWPVPLAAAEPHPNELDEGPDSDHREQTRIQNECDGMRRNAEQDLDHSRAASRIGSGYSPAATLTASTSATPIACRPRGTARLRPRRKDPGSQSSIPSASASASGQ